MEDTEGGSADYLNFNFQAGTGIRSGPTPTPPILVALHRVLHTLQRSPRTMVLWGRDSGSASASSPLCSVGGGLWPTLEAFVSFLVTNIVAHAATIHLPTGLDTASNVRAVLASIFMPVFSGDRAFHSINRWLTRLFKGKMGINDIFGGSTFEDAATSGVVAISVPLRFAPLVSRRWDKATRHQFITMLDNKEYWPSNSNTTPKLPFKISSKSQQYVSFILPPTTRFPGYENYKLSPTSSWLPQIIGIIQAVLSSRQLFLNYSSSLVTEGLSSPYIIVIPYIFMSLMNLLANTLVNSYTQVTMLPMAHDPLPKDNDALISGSDASTPEEYKLRVLALREKEAPGTSASVPSTSQKISVTNNNNPISPLPDTLEIEGIILLYHFS